MKRIQINELTTLRIQGIVNANNNQFTITNLEKLKMLGLH